MVPERVIENDDRVIQHRRPNVFVVDKSAGTSRIIDAAISSDHNNKRKEYNKFQSSELRLLDYGTRQQLFPL